MKTKRSFTRADLEGLRPVRGSAQLLEPISELVRRINRESQKALRMAQACNRQTPRRVRSEVVA